MMDFELLDKHVKEHTELYLKEVVQPSFPFIEFFSGLSWGSDQVGAAVDIPKFNWHFKESDYYYSESNKFIHYTNLRNLINILNEGFMRAYDLNYPDDPQELLYAGKELLGNYTIENLKTLRSLTYVLSMCIYDEEKYPDEFDLWRLYGNNGYGVGIIFGFRGDTERWDDDFISRVYYGDSDKIEIFKKFLYNHNEFHSKYHFKILPNRLLGEPGKIPEWIAIFLGFHKSGLYKLENEVRLLSYDSSLAYSDFSLGFSINSKYQKCLYRKIPLLTSENLFNLAEKRQVKLPNYKRNFSIYEKELIEDITLFTPVIEIEKIILGYRYNENDLKKIREALEFEFMHRTNFSLKIDLSSLVDKFDLRENS